MSVFLNLHEGAELQGLRDRSGGEHERAAGCNEHRRPPSPKGPAAASDTPTDTPQGRG